MKKALVTGGCGFIEGFWFLMDVPLLAGKERIRSRIFADCEDCNNIEVVL